MDCKWISYPFLCSRSSSSAYQSLTHSQGSADSLTRFGTDHSSITIHRAHPPPPPSLRPFTHKSGSNRTTITRVLYRKRGMASTILSSFKSLRGRVEKNGSFEQGYSMINSSLNPCSTKSFCILPPYQKTLGRGHKYFIDFFFYSWSKT